MGKPTGFLEFTRELPKKRPVEERVHDYNEFIHLYEEEKLNHQAARCMDCGVPFCHNGCPVGNLIPDFIARTGKKLMKYFLPLTIFLSLPVAFVRHLVKVHVCWA